MVLRPYDIQAMREQFGVDFLEQPVTSSESTDENDMLECKFKAKDRKRKKGDAQIQVCEPPCIGLTLH